MTIEEITADIYRLSLGWIACFVVKHSEGAALVDTGLPAHTSRILAALSELHLAPREIRFIVLTHRHLDHAGGAAALALKTGAEVIVQREDAAAVEGRERLSPVRGWIKPLLEPLVAFSDRYLFHYTGCAVTAVEEGWQAAGLSLLHLPGHTPGHSGYLHAKSGTLF
jgi:glyoxylase-like metal-dependent hydrolase (beta-lactamase superfamily II)